jgi:acetyltransferase-like isoleucine patch superfamily enzyme
MKLNTGGIWYKLALFGSYFTRIFYKLIYGRKVQFGKNVIVAWGLCIRGKGTLYLGDNVNLWTNREINRFNFYDRDAVIRIGNGCRVNGVTMECEKSITIGEECIIGSATVIDTDFHIIENSEHIMFGREVSRPITIGDEVWLGSKSAVLKGSKIGDRSVVGFGAVVSGEVPSDVVVAGNPAQVVREKE